MTKQPHPPSLDVQAYHVHELWLRALEDYEPERPSRGGISVDFDVQQSEADQSRYRIIMRINLAEGGYSPEENPPYALRIVIFGYFAFDEGTSEEVMLRMINFNGLSILYGIARGLMGQATGSSVHGQFLLPAVNFVGLLEKKAESEKAQAALTDKMERPRPEKSPRAASKANARSAGKASASGLGRKKKSTR